MKWFKNLRYRIFYGLLLKKNPRVISMGNRSVGCAWNFCPDGLDGQSIVYSGGVGRDITFEHALVEEFGPFIVLIDPSPTGQETMSKKENQISQFKFCAVGLAGRCGSLKLSPPMDEEEGSWSAFSEQHSMLEVPTLDLETLMKQNGHNHVDLLKLDIEGAEYDVLDDLLKKKIPIRQVLVEFHHGILSGVRRSQSVRAILKMTARGYKLLNQEGNNHTFYLPQNVFEVARVHYTRHSSAYYASGVS
jgi:FkbM family methyltransferase